MIALDSRRRPAWPGLRDRERAASIAPLQAVVCARRGRAPRSPAAHGQSVRVADNGHDQPVVERHRDADAGVRGRRGCRRRARFTRWVLVMNTFQWLLTQFPTLTSRRTRWVPVSASSGRDASSGPASSGMGREDPHRGLAGPPPHVPLRRDRRPAAGRGARLAGRRDRRPARGRRASAPSSSSRASPCAGTGSSSRPPERRSPSSRSRARWPWAERRRPAVDAPTLEEEGARPATSQPFFDPVFVFAFTQVTSLILEDTIPQGFARAALVLAMVPWAWSAYAWINPRN